MLQRPFLFLLGAFLSTLLRLPSSSAAPLRNGLVFQSNEPEDIFGLDSSRRGNAERLDLGSFVGSGYVLGTDASSIVMQPMLVAMDGESGRSHVEFQESQRIPWKDVNLGVNTREPLLDLPLDLLAARLTTARNGNGPVRFLSSTVLKSDARFLYNVTGNASGVFGCAKFPSGPAASQFPVEPEGLAIVGGRVVKKYRLASNFVRQERKLRPWSWLWLWNGSSAMMETAAMQQWFYVDVASGHLVAQKSTFQAGPGGPAFSTILRFSHTRTLSTELDKKRYFDLSPDLQKLCL